MQAVGVIRISTLGQSADDKLSLSDQRRLIEEWCKAKGHDLVRVLEDVMFGDLIDRPGLNTAVDMLRSKQVQVLVAATPDRLTRNQNLMGSLKIDAVRAGGIIAFADPIYANYDNTIEGRILTAVAGIFSEVERATTRRRTMVGRANRTKVGRKLIGNGRGIYGYVVTDGRTTVDESEKVIVIRIFKQFAEGWSYQAIVDRLTADGIPAPYRTPWSITSLRHILKRTDYVGRGTRLNGTEDVSDIIPALLDPGLWDRVQARLADGSHTRKDWLAKPPVGPLHGGGIVVCGECGWPLTLVRNNRKGQLHPAFRCYKAIQKDVQHGSWHAVPYRFVQRAVNELIKEMALRDVDENAVITKTQDAWFDAEIRAAEKEEAKFDQQAKNLSSRLPSAAGDDELWSDIMQALRDARTKRDVAKARWTALTYEHGDLGRAAKAVKDVQTWLKTKGRYLAMRTWSDKQWRECYRRIGLRVKIYGNGWLEADSIVMAGSWPIVSQTAGTYWNDLDWSDEWYDEKTYRPRPPIDWQALIDLDEGFGPDWIEDASTSCPMIESA